MRENPEERFHKSCAPLLTCVFAALVAVVSGCVKSKVVVYVNPDGSGNLVVSRVFDRATVESAEAQRASVQVDFMDNFEMPSLQGISGSEQVRAEVVKQIEALKAQYEEMRVKKAADLFFDEKSLRREAKTYGTGVKFVKARRLDIDGGTGFVAVYSFKDINDVFIAPDVSRLQSVVQGGFAGGITDPFAAVGGEEDEEEDRGRRGKQGLEFNFQTGAVSRLKILLPAPEAGDDGDSGEEEKEGEEDEGKDESAVDRDAREWLSPYGSMLCDSGYRGGAHPGAIAVGLDVVFNGQIVTSNASHTNAAGRSRIVLLDLDSSRRPPKNAATDPFAGDDDLYAYYDFNRLIKAVLKEPGATVETNREVVVEFR